MFRYTFVAISARRMEQSSTCSIEYARQAYSRSHSKLKSLRRVNNMNASKLIWLNGVGIVALSVLCISQWNVNRELNHGINRLEDLRQDQAEKLDERDATVVAQAHDLKNLRAHLTELTGELRKVEGELALAKNQVQMLEENVKQWKSAVEERDKQIKFANERIRELVGEFNTLAENYKMLSEELNKRIEEYNELVKRRR